MTDTDGAIQSKISEYWSRQGVTYDFHQLDQLRHDAVRQAWIDIWRRTLPAPPVKVLDVGTGTGHVSLMLAELGYAVNGIDLAKGMLEQAWIKAARMPRNAPILEIGDAVSPDFSPASFDVLTARYVLWTLRTPEVALANWRTLLRPGGLLVAIDSTWFPDGIHRSTPDVPSDPAEKAAFGTLYDDAVMSVLPLAEARTIEDTADTVRAAGFGDVTVTPLHEILELDQKYGVSPGHNVQLQYLITATAE